MKRTPSRETPSLFLFATALMLIAFAPSSALAADNALENGDFTLGPAGAAPTGWSHRTAGQGYVHTVPDGDRPHVEIGVNQPGEDSFIQQIVPLSPEVKAYDLSIDVWHDGIEPGDSGHQKGRVQARFTKQGKDFGKWFDIANLTGSSDGWGTKQRRIGGAPGDADGLMLRVGFYGVKNGVMRAANARLAPVTEQDIVVERARYRPAEAFGPAVTDERYNRLLRGININNWFCQPWNIRVNGQKGGFNAETFRAYITEHDIRLIADAGFDHIRLPVDPTFIMDKETGDLKTDLLPELDRAIEMIRDHGLAVIVDVHPKSNAYKKMRGKPMADKFVEWWGQLAAHLSTTDPEWVFLELLNEPGGQGFWTQSYGPYQDRLLTIVRENAPDHTIIASGGAYMLVKELERIEPHTDRNVIWAVHYYEPSPFTHQGAVWMKDWYRPLRRVPWPLDKNNVGEAVSRIDQNDKAAGKAADALRGIANSGWGSKQNIREHMAEIVAWGEKHDRRLVVGEWGVYDKYVDPTDRVRYLEFMTEVMDEHGLGWSKWDYVGGGFPIVTNPDAPSGRRELDSEVIAALNLER